MAKTTKGTSSGTTSRAASKGAVGARSTAVPASSLKAEAKAAPTGRSRAKAPPAPSKPAKAPIVTMKHLAGALSESRDIPKCEAEALVAEFVGTLVGHIKDGAKVRIAGLGVLEVKDRPARMARNPATGEQVHVEASRKVAFRPAKELKEAI